MKYIEFYNMNNILEYRIKVEEYQVGDVGVNFFTRGFHVDFDKFFKGITEVDELNKKVSYDINCCRPEEYFKMKLIDKDLVIRCDKVVLGMIDNGQLFFQPLFENRAKKTMVRYYASFVEIPKIEHDI